MSPHRSALHREFRATSAWRPPGKDVTLDQAQVKIRFEGRTLTCRSGITVAVALWENGIRALSRSPKYGHPRGVACARGHCTGCLMRVDGRPNVRTCELKVREGMDIRRQDTGAFYGPLLQKTVDAGHRFFPVGFYYKWFTRPPFVSRTFLRGIRPLTGVGRIPTVDDSATPMAEDLGRVETVVIGAGPSGLEAAAASSGQVLLIDENEASGGQRGPALDMVAAAGDLDGFPLLAAAHQRLVLARQKLDSRPDIRFAGGTRVIAGYQPDGLLLREGEQLLTVACGKLIWAAGALDTLGLFPGNDTPGLLGPRALYRLVLRDGLRLEGLQVLIVGRGLDFWLSAALCAAGGARPTLVLTSSREHDEVAAAVQRNWPLHTGLVVGRVRRAGPARLDVALRPRSVDGATSASHLDMETDLLVVCNSGKPAYDIPHQLGRALALDPDRGGFLPTGSGSGSLCEVLPGGLTLDFRGEAAGDHPGEARNLQPEAPTP